MTTEASKHLISLFTMLVLAQQLGSCNGFLITKYVHHGLNSNPIFSSRETFLIPYSTVTMDATKFKQNDEVEIMNKQLHRTFMKYIIFLIVVFIGISTNNVNPSQAADQDARGMSCVAKHCSQELSKCLSDSTCSKGLGCFISCSTMDALKSQQNLSSDNNSNNQREGTCQVRCMDLYQNDVLDDFTECTLTNYKCYESIKADDRYPLLSNTLSDERLLGSINTAENELKEIFRGKWYIVGGLNKAFDTFDCQVHEFFDPIDDQVGNRKSDRVIADATFSYRIKNNKGYFTKNGDKRLILSDIQNNEEATLQDNEYHEGSGKWGIDSFMTNQKGAPFVNDANVLSGTKQDGRKLKLMLRPSKMNYVDDWTILSYSTEADKSFIVVAYRGTNSAWDGYGGVNVYSREPIDISTLKDPHLVKGNERRITMRNGISSGLGKIGLTIDDLYPINYKCL